MARGATVMVIFIKIHHFMGFSIVNALAHFSFSPLINHLLADASRFSLLLRCNRKVDEIDVPNMINR